MVGLHCELESSKSSLLPELIVRFAGYVVVVAAASKSVVLSTFEYSNRRLLVARAAWCRTAGDLALKLVVLLKLLNVSFLSLLVATSCA